MYPNIARNTKTIKFLHCCKQPRPSTRRVFFHFLLSGQNSNLLCPQFGALLRCGHSTRDGELFQPYSVVFLGVHYEIHHLYLYDHPTIGWCKPFKSLLNSVFSIFAKSRRSLCRTVTETDLTSTLHDSGSQFGCRTESTGYTIWSSWRTKMLSNIAINFKLFGDDRW